jgi:serine/threonine protein kinase
MPKRKATGDGAGRRTKRTRTTGAEVFVWQPTDWVAKRTFTENISLLVRRTNAKQFIIKKELEADDENDASPTEVRALALLPDCNRIVKPILYSHKHPDEDHGTAFFQNYPLGDLFQWKRTFTTKNRKAVPESFIWRVFLQISQALAIIQGRLGPDRDMRGCMIHRDIKPTNILVVDNGSTYPSFKLQDFDVAMMWERSKARQPDRVGTFQWQPSEAPTQGTDTRAADVWALGACIHFLATGLSPIEDVDEYAAAVYQDNNQHPDLARLYGGHEGYYDAHVPRRVIPINLSKDELHERGLGLSTEEKRDRGIGPKYHQYSDELNDWMTQCLHRTPSKRSITERLVNEMGIIARSMLRKMGGKAALMDLEAKFGDDA